ncbi:MAG: TPM domain-containing protein [Chitinophagaceae bacterium]
MSKLRYLLTALLVCLALSNFAQTIPNPPNPPRLVNDLAEILTPFDADQLEKKLVAYEKESSNEIAVVTVKSIGENEVQEYARDLGRKWQIGKAEKRNGVLLLIAVQERKINISPGDGLQGAITDVICSRIIRNTITPAFRENAFYTGLDSATSQLMRAAKGEFTAEPEPEKHNIGGAEIAIVILIFLLIVAFTIAKPHPITYVSGRGWTSRRRGPWDDGPGMPWGGGGFGGFGGGGGSSSGGGFGGFGGGGGGFDGGGASGSW